MESQLTHESNYDEINEHLLISYTILNLRGTKKRFKLSGAQSQVINITQTKKERWLGEMVNDETNQNI